MQRHPSPAGNASPPPVSDFPPYFRKNVETPWEIFHNFNFSPKIFFNFHLPKFLSHSLRIQNFPLFSLFQYISPNFGIIIISPLLLQIFPSDFVKSMCFLHTFCVFRFPPQFDHDAFMHHTMHVLDAPDAVLAIAIQGGCMRACCPIAL